LPFLRVVHFDTFPPLPEEAAVMADAVGREESKISLAGEGKESIVILATKCTTETVALEMGATQRDSV